MSHIFADSPIREPPTGRKRDILNQKYDHILVCLDAILNRAERGLEEVRIAVTEAREAVEQRRQCYTQRRRDNFPGTQFFLDKLLILKKGLGQGTPKQLAELKKKSEFFDGSLSPSGNRPLGEKALSGQMLLELNLSLPFPCV